MISLISLLEIINAALLDPNIILWTAASAAANGIKTLLASGLNAFSIKGKPVFSNGPKSIPKNSSHCPILCNWFLIILY